MLEIMSQTSSLPRKLLDSELIPNKEPVDIGVPQKSEIANVSSNYPFEVSQISSEMVETYYYLGCINFKRQEYDCALAWLNRVIILNPNHLQAHLTLAKIFDLQGKANKNALMRANAEKIIKNSIGQTEHLQDAVIANTNFGDSYYCLGKTHYSQGNLQLAQRYWQQAADCCPDNPDYNYQLAQSMENNQDLVNAIKYYQKTVSISPNHWQAHFSLGYIFAQQEKWDWALSSFRKVQQIQPDSFWAYNNIGNIYLKLKKWTQARNNYLKALSCKHNIAHAGWCHYHLGIAYSQLERWDQALSYYKQAQKILEGESDIATKIAQVRERQEYIELAITSVIA